jgi:hypothetical protein
MWKLALGVMVFLQAGVLQANEDEAPSADVDVAGVKVEESAAPGDCPANEGLRAAAHPCVSDEAVVLTPATPVATPAAVAASVPSPTARATVSFRNDVGNKLRLVEARFTMDGADLPTVVTGAEPGKSYVVFGGAVKPGPHVVTARLTYQGERRVFSYMKGYKLNVRSEQVLTTPENRAVSFTVVGAEKTGMTVPLEQRLVVKVEESAR